MSISPEAKHKLFDRITGKSEWPQEALENLYMCTSPNTVTLLALIITVKHTRLETI